MSKLSLASPGKMSSHTKKKISSQTFFVLKKLFSTVFFVLVFLFVGPSAKVYIVFCFQFCGCTLLFSLCDRSWVRTMSDMEEAEQRLNLVEILLANIGLDA